MFFINKFNSAYKYKKLDISDREWVQQLIKEDRGYGCEYTFASMFLWQDVYLTTYSELNNCLIRKSEESKERISYHYPIGTSENRIRALEFLYKIAKKRHQELFLYGVLDETLEELKDIFGNKLTYELVRDNQNYIYRTEDIASLAGKKYYSHRKNIKKFKENKAWFYEPITKENAPLCNNLCDLWYFKQEKSEGKEQELEVIKKAIQYYDQLKLEGGILKINDMVVAFIIGEPLNDNIFVEHFQKALRNIKGSNQMIFHLHANEILPKFKYINCEEDMGIEGIRTAKMRWAPKEITNSYTVTI